MYEELNYRTRLAFRRKIISLFKKRNITSVSCMIFAMLNVSIVRFYLELRMIEIDVEIQISLFGLRQNSQITQIGYEVQLKETLITLIKMDLFPTRVQTSASRLCKTNHEFLLQNYYKKILTHEEVLKSQSTTQSLITMLLVKNKE